FQILDDTERPGRWFLRAPVSSEGEELDPEFFQNGTAVKVEQRLSIPMRQPGLPLDFTFATLIFQFYGHAWPNSSLILPQTRFRCCQSVLKDNPNPSSF